MIQYLLPGIVAGIFVIVGFCFLAIDFLFKSKGKPLTGKIMAIERFVSRSNDSGRQAYYAPIVEYQFNGESIWFKAGGSNILRHYIGQSVDVLSLPYGPRMCRINDNLLIMFGSIFSLVGLAIIGGIYYKTGTDYVFYPLLIEFGMAYYFFCKIKKKIESLEDLPKSIKWNTLETKDSLQGRHVYWSNKDIDRINKKNSKMGMIVSTLFLLIMGTSTTIVWTRMGPSQKGIIKSILDMPGSVLEILKNNQDPLIIGFCALLFFSLLSIYSLFYSLKKIKS